MPKVYKLVLTDMDVAMATLIKYTVTQREQPPRYNVIRINLSSDYTVKEENPMLPSTWAGRWRITNNKLYIITGEYTNIIDLTAEQHGIYQAVEYYNGIPTDIVYDVIIAEVILSEIMMH